MRHSIVFITLLLSLGGCATQYTADYSEKAAQQTNKIEAWQGPVAGAEAVSLITDLVSSADIKVLINEALQNNPGIQQQYVALKTTQVARSSVNADRLPSVSAGLSGNRQETSDAQYTGSLDISWELDLWQKLGDNVAAADWAVAASEADVKAVQNELAAQVIRAYVQVSYYQQLIAIEQSRLSLLDNNEDLIKQRYRAGLGELEDLDTARTSSASSRADIAAYQQSLGESVRALGVLLGRSQLTLNDISFPDKLPDVMLPLPGLPEQNLSQRPDLMAAYANIKTREYETKAAYKALLPSVNLSAALSDTATTPAQALLTNPVWSLLGQITAPLFQGGALRASIDTSELAVLNSWWAYQSTLLTAVQEVEDALSQEQSLTLQSVAIKEALANAERSSENYTSKYRQGLADVLDLLTVYQQTYNLKAQLLQLYFNQLSNRIDLGLALGLGVSA